MNKAVAVTGTSFYYPLLLLNIQLFQLRLSDKGLKLKDKTER